MLADRTEKARRVTQSDHEREYQQSLVNIKVKLREVEGPDMKETMQDQIRQWFIECRSVFTYVAIELFHVTSCCPPACGFCSNGNQYSFMQASFYIIVRDSLSMNFSIRGSSA